MNHELNGEEPAEVQENLEGKERFDITEVVANSPVLARLVEEVRNENLTVGKSYDRMHNRHNRSR